MPLARTRAERRARPLESVEFQIDRRIRDLEVSRYAARDSISEAPRPAIYVPLQPFYVPDAILVVATTGEPLSVLPGVEAAVRELDPNVPLFEVRTMTEHLGFATFVRRTAASVVTGLGVVALLQAAIGLYCAIAGSVRLRTPEIGMRGALGASRREIVRMASQARGIAAMGVAAARGRLERGTFGIRRCPALSLPAATSPSRGTPPRPAPTDGRTCWAP